MNCRLILLIILLFLLRSTAVLQAQFIQPDALDWQKVRDAQPDGLSLKLDLPKTRFHLGEVINATLIFANSTSTVYSLWTGEYDRSGRIRDIAFLAKDSDGNLVPDLLRWYFQRGYLGGGLGGTANLGAWSISISANQWLAFSKPGTYTLYAYSNRVREGDRSSTLDGATKSIELVSNPITITIEPLPAANEQRILAEAAASLAAGGEAAGQAVTTLRFLGSPAARAMLLPLLDGPHAFQVGMAYYAADDPVAEADSVLAAVRAGKIKLNSSVVHLYGTLKTASFQMNVADGPVENHEARAQKYRAEFKAASEEVTAAAVAASGGKGPDYYETLLTALFGDPEKRPQVRAELVQVQLDLTPEQGERILHSWRSFGGEDFLPLARKLVAAPFLYPVALKALAEVKPEEARMLIIEDLQRQKPLYLVPGTTNGPLLSLPPEPIPELEAYFRAQLTSRDPPHRDLLIAAVERYGGAALLPEMIALYTAKEGRWACNIQSAFLRFWLRCDEDGGVEALRRGLATREFTGCFRRLLGEVLLKRWTEKALPIVMEALEDNDADVVGSAVQVLEAHVDASFADACISALQRLNNKVALEDHPVRTVSRNSARQLLQSTRWKLEQKQREQLDRIANK